MEAVKIRKREMSDYLWINRSAIKRDGKTLGANGVAILAAIACCENTRSGDAFPSQSWISEHLNISIKTVGRYLKILEATGYIKRLKKTGFVTYYTLTQPMEPRTQSLVTPDTESVPPRTQSPTNNSNLNTIINETHVVPKEPKPYILATNYFYSAYKQKYNREYPVNRGRYYKQLKDNYSELTFDTFKSMIDDYLETGGEDFQKMLFRVPELYKRASDRKRQTMARDPRLDMTPLERIQADGWAD